MKCPSCGYENIPGEDTCSGCGHDLHGTEVSDHERSGASEMLLLPVVSIPCDDPFFVADTTPVDDVLNVMREKSLTCVIVKSGDNAAGIFTDRDILYKLSPVDKNIDNIKISDLMSPNPQVLKEHDTLAYAINKMALSGYRHLPIVDSKGKYVKILTVMKLFDFLSQS